MEQKIYPIDKLEATRILETVTRQISPMDITAKPIKRRPHMFRLLAIAAVLSCFLVVTAVASTLILKMTSNPIPYFENNKAASHFDSIKGNLETYNATVDLSATDNGITATLENIAVDDNFINLFMTFTSDTDINLDKYKNGEKDIANLFALFFASPNYRFYIDGKLIESSTVGQNDVLEVSMPDKRTMKVMYHFAVGEEIPDVFTLTARSPFIGTPNGETPSTIFDKTVKWDFTVNIDKTGVKSTSRKIAPQTLGFDMDGITRN